MILRSLHLENYKQYSQLDLEFREGLVGIIGRNGAGKSTLFEAVLYCLFGKDESNKMFIRSSFVEPKATVVLALQFAVGPAEYAVKREFRGKAMAVNAELFKNDQLVAKGVAPVNEEISKVLNMEREAFKRSVFSGQKELSELSEANGEVRKRMVRKMLGLDTLDDIQTRMNADTRDLGNQIAGQRQNLLDPEVVQVMEGDVEEQNKLVAANESELKKEQKSLQKVESEYQLARQKFEAEEQKRQRFQTLQQESGRLQERLEGLHKQLTALAQKIRDLEAQQANLAGQQATFSTFESDKKRLKKLESERQRQLNRNAYLAQIDEMKRPVQECRLRLGELAKSLANKENLVRLFAEKRQQVATLEQVIEQKREEYNAIKSRMDALNARMEERQSKILNLKTIGREGTCPTCLQPVLDAYDSVLATLHQEIESMEKGDLAALEQQKQALTLAGQQLRQQQADVQREIKVLEKEEAHIRELEKQKVEEETTLKNYEAQTTRIQVVLREIGDVHFDETAYNALKSSIEATEPRFLQFTNETAYILRELPATRTAREQTEKSATETRQTLEVKTKELSQTGFNAEQYESAKLALTRFGDAYAAQSGKVRTLEKNGMELQNRIKQNIEKLRANERIREQVSSKLAEVDVLKKLSELLIQFKTEILERVSPSISMEASELFSRITKGKYERIFVDENFDFSIADGGILYPIERFSGGEVDLANFCLRIAITKAIMDLSGNGQGVEFLAFDEIFGSQDEERRHEMMMALNYLQEQFRQIYIVSHIDSQKDYFPNLLEVTYQPDGSVVKWV